MVVLGGWAFSYERGTPVYTISHARKLAILCTHARRQFTHAHTADTQAARLSVHRSFAQLSTTRQASGKALHNSSTLNKNKSLTLNKNTPTLNKSSARSCVYSVAGSGFCSQILVWPQMMTSSVHAHSHAHTRMQAGEDTPAQTWGLFRC